MTILADPSGLIVGDAETVGIRYFPGEEDKCPPFRVLYPASFNVRHSSSLGEENEQEGSTTTTRASNQTSRRRVSWFHEHGVAFFWNGYLHVAGIKKGSWLFAFLSTAIGAIASIATFSCSVLGWNGLHFPRGLLSVDAPPAIVIETKKKDKKPLIVFSHGLTGTGEENLLLMSAWAKMGFVVVSVHHTDGSSCRVRIQNAASVAAAAAADGFYKHGPPFANYDATFRPKQILHRTRDIQQALEFVATSPDLAKIRSICNIQEIISAGFSYGAATAVLVAHTIPQRIKGLILLDGWFYIDVSQAAGIEFEFPPQAFLPEDGSDLSTIVPSVFINSEAFESYTKIYQATRRLARQFSGSGSVPRQNETPLSFDNMHVLKGTQHNNFCDVIFWFPTRLLRYLGVIGQGCDPRDRYREIIRISSDFLKTNFHETS
ncbi:unnamed protein product [Cylindrotheca closterium]|uniref:1-alkyl-2-acetylglycerophosphocholine esterase n=1 Tax=Cylindrotheca closterium TaxID=2856 RepID=A0AAD2G618_9STRA|nr:unnamed protein product [Cylindrotheca closterium]